MFTKPFGSADTEIKIICTITVGSAYTNKQTKKKYCFIFWEVFIQVTVII
ncbi:hypothetical protein NT01EI_3317 [Edwardsiella ictaluri 93-146]|uniref:Uncharacterized protein n=1 Tax=Edwardsiella ictaluri (strain 93-146) TaxID=634503 RepID=C5B928_EDWI9|nr:hypothetical protein NT01EI_3317 [Edwardsiella ictaluri 93-146]